MEAPRRKNTQKASQTGGGIIIIIGTANRKRNRRTKRGKRKGVNQKRLDKGR